MTEGVRILWNPLLKNIVLRRRPYLDHPNVRCLRPVEADADIPDISAQGYSFPSGHSTNSATLFGSLSAYRRQRVLTVLAFVVPFLVGIIKGVINPKKGSYLWNPSPPLLRLNLR